MRRCPGRGAPGVAREERSAGLPPESGLIDHGPDRLARGCRALPIVVHVVATTPGGDIRQTYEAIWDHLDAHQIRHPRGRRSHLATWSGMPSTRLTSGSPGRTWTPTSSSSVPSRPSSASSSCRRPRWASSSTSSCHRRELESQQRRRGATSPSGSGRGRGPETDERVPGVGAGSARGGVQHRRHARRPQPSAWMAGRLPSSARAARRRRAERPDRQDRCRPRAGRIAVGREPRTAGNGLSRL